MCLINKFKTQTQIVDYVCVLKNVCILWVCVDECVCVYVFD